MAHFTDGLALATRRCGNPVVVGLDPRWESLPSGLTKSASQGLTKRGMTEKDLAERASVYRLFCRDVIDVVAPLVPAVKPQSAFFEELGPAGMQVLADVIKYAQKQGLLVLLDAKRSDIGSTAEAYAGGMLGRDQSAWGADALTVNPYLGDDSLEPFVKTATQRGAGLFVLVKTSNPGGGTFQDLTVDEKPLYLRVAALVESLSEQTRGDCGYGIVGAVVGATYPEQMAKLRSAMPQTWFLVPGFGSQGGSASDVAAAFDGRGLGAIINSSRGIIFAHNRPEFSERFGPSRWQDAVEAATKEMIAQLRAETPAGKLPAPASNPPPLQRK
jgi:orotidine-5'-phosphate decarboxylase